MLDNLCEKYGEDFNWSHPNNLHIYEVEIKKELYETHKLYGLDLKAVAKCEANDVVLFSSFEKFYIVHLTWKNAIEFDGYPKYKEFDNVRDVLSYIEKDYIDNYM